MAADPRDCVITGIGMRCSVGHNAIQSCSSIRAGVNRFLEWDRFGAAIGVDEAVVKAAPVSPDLGDAAWIDKIDDLSEQPLMEAIWNAGAYNLLNANGNLRSGLFLAVPLEDRAGISPSDLGEFQQQYEEGEVISVLRGPRQLYPQEHVGGLVAMADAMEALEHGELDIAIVGGIDSLLHSPHLYELLESERLLTNFTPAGLIPGEAGAFVIVEHHAHAQRRGVRPLAQLTPIRLSRDEDSQGGRQPTRAGALARVLQQTMNDIPCEPSFIHRVLTDLNGERWRFLEFSLAQNRALAALPPDWQPWHPADCIGDVGGASSIAHLCIAVRAFARNYAVGAALPLYAASVSGERAATCVYPWANGN